MDRVSLRYEDYLREHQLYIYQVGYGVHVYCESCDEIKHSTHTHNCLTALCLGLPG